MVKREDETDELVVHWDSQRCIHTAMCLNLLPEMFDVGDALDPSRQHPDRRDRERASPAGPARPAG
jgi:ferredoxin